MSAGAPVAPHMWLKDNFTTNSGKKQLIEAGNNDAVGKNPTKIIRQADS